MSYVDGYLLAVPKANLETYKDMARQCSVIFKEYGATAYVETVGDDVPYGELTSFPRAVMAKDDEVVIFSWIVYPDKATRDAANEKVHKDPRLEGMMKDSPFDGKRMIWGGFNAFLEV